MKYPFFILSLFAICTAKAQNAISYEELLQLTPETDLADSLLFDGSNKEVTALDSATVKQWFQAVIPAGSKNRLKNRSYALLGKITTQPNYNLLILLEEKKRSDTSNVQVIYFITTKKDGQYIAKLEVAVKGEKKESGYNITSLLYKDYKIVQDSKITLHDKSITDITCYKINGGGRFILYPRE